MKTLMIRVAALLAISLLSFTLFADPAHSAKPAKPAKNSGWYVMILWEPGTPVPGSNG